MQKTSAEPGFYLVWQWIGLAACLILALQLVFPAPRWEPGLWLPLVVLAISLLIGLLGLIRRARMARGEADLTPSAPGDQPLQHTKCDTMMPHRPMAPESTGYDSPGDIEELGTREAELIHASLSKSLTSGSREARRYIESMPVGLVSVNAAGTVLSANLKALLLLNSSIDKVIKRAVNELLVFDSGSCSFEHLISATLATSREAYAVSPASGKRTPVDVSLSAYEGQSGPGYILCLTDTSDRREVQRLKNEFLSLVTHDLRSPLTAVGLFLSNLLSHEDEALSAKNRRLATIAAGELERLNRLINSLLDLSMLRDGKLRLQPGHVAIAELLASLGDSLSLLTERQGVTLRCTGDGSSVWADRDRLYQVLENLTSNALKYSPPGSEIVVSANKTDDGHLFEVRDFGPGIPEESRERIFGRFEQLSSEDYQRFGGRGLGLAICKFIVEAHGGRIGVRPGGDLSRESLPNSAVTSSTSFTGSAAGEVGPDTGSVFWFSIPARDSMAP